MTVDGPWALSRSVWHPDAGLSGHERAVLWVMIQHADADGGSCFPSDAKVAACAGVSPASVKRARIRLHELGLVARTFRSGLPNQYRVNLCAVANLGHGDLGHRDLGQTDPGPRSQGPRTEVTVTYDRTQHRTQDRTHAARDFGRFWDAYPRKCGKRAALRAWNRLGRERPPIAEILAAIDSQKRSSDWQKESGRFIPHPATWLNDGRWSDEATPGTGAEPDPNAALLAEFERAQGVHP